MSQYALPFITKRGRREHRRRTKTKRAYLVTVQGKTPCFVSAHDPGEATSTVLHAVKVIAGPKITPIDLRIRRVPALDPWAIHAQPKPETAESLAAEFPISIERLRDIIEAAKPRPTAPISPWTRPGPDKSAWAVLDQERHYRYVLWRQWDCGLPYVAFIGVNPSTADEVTDDATIRVCRGYAERWGYGGLAMVNLFAFRATDPKVMKAEPNCVGAHNNTALLAVCLGAAKVICAWGTNGNHCDRDFQVVDTLTKAGITLHALKLTNEGFPAHPLRQKAGLEPIVFKNGLGDPLDPAEIPLHLKRCDTAAITAALIESTGTNPATIPPPVGYDSWEAYHVAGLQSAKELLDSAPAEMPTEEDCKRLGSFLARKPAPETDEQRALKAELLKAAQRTTQLTQ